MVSYGEIVAIRSSCKPQECNKCQNKFVCPSIARICINWINYDTYRDESSNSKANYVVRNDTVLIEKLEDTPRARKIQKHITLVNELL